jgi:hypothetical protein
MYLVGHADQRREQQAAIERLRAEHKHLGERMSAMYIDKLDGKIGGDFYDKFPAEWREEQLRLQREIDRHEAAEQSYMDEGVQILELARNAQKLFERKEPRQKRRLLNFVLSNCSWEDGEVRATFRQPFDLPAETTARPRHQRIREPRVRVWQVLQDESCSTAKWAEGNDWLRLTSDDQRQVRVCLMGALQCVGFCWRRRCSVRRPARRRPICQISRFCAGRLPTG